ncbi:DUF58 domain-containing protein, partial [Thermodesulfobacteriota bacterium]
MIRRLLYRNFRATFAVRRWLLQRFTPGGLMVLVCVLTAGLFGLDTNRTMAYQMFAFLLCLIVVSMAWSMFFRGRFTVRRKLPPYAMAGSKLTYTLSVENQTAKRQPGLYAREILQDRLPSFEEFTNTPEPGEERRNFFDRRVGYYRWEWLLAMRLEDRVAEKPIPALQPGGTEAVQV